MSSELEHTIEAAEDDGPETVAEFIERRNVRMAAHFRGAGPMAGEDSFTDDPRATHWGIAIAYGGRQMHTSYHMGSAHYRWKAGSHFLPSAGRGSMYNGAKRGERVPWGRPRTLFDEQYLRDHSEPQPPELADVLDSLRSDAETYITSGNFEEWCSNLGYDSDSRKAEGIYRACGEITRKLQALFGPEVLAELLQTERL